MLSMGEFVDWEKSVSCDLEAGLLLFASGVLAVIDALSLIFQVANNLEPGNSNTF